MNSRHVAVSSVVCAVALALSGCATIVSGTRQTITVNSNPPGAQVAVGDQTGLTPATFEIPKGRTTPVVVSRYSDKRVVTLNRNVDPMTFLNIIPPLWPGFIVDAVTGSITKYDPDVVMVDFTTEPTVAAQLTTHNK